MVAGDDRVCNIILHITFHLFKSEHGIVFHISFYSRLLFFYISNIEKININNDAKSLQMETFLTIDEQHDFKNITIKESDDK